MEFILFREGSWPAYRVAHGLSKRDDRQKYYRYYRRYQRKQRPSPYNISDHLSPLPLPLLDNNHLSPLSSADESRDGVLTGQVYANCVAPLSTCPTFPPVPTHTCTSPSSPDWTKKPNTRKVWSDDESDEETDDE